MEIKKIATAGTLESGDLFVSLEQANNGIEIDLKSSVEKQYGKQIRGVIEKTLISNGITSAKITVNDKGALDCTIKARVQTVIYRACECTDYKWGE